MKKRLGSYSMAAMLSFSCALAGEAAPSDRSFEFTDLQWYGSVNSAYLVSSSDVNFYGTTSSVYGGAPTIEMDDGSRLSLALGLEIPGGWRLEGELAYLNLNTDNSSVFGIDDRADDVFVIDAEVESLVFMLNAAYDFGLSDSRFRPFVKGGIGVARNKTTQADLDVQFNSPIWNGSVFEGQSLSDYPYPEGKSTQFAWNIGVGLKMQLAQKFALSLEYGLIDIGKTQTGFAENGDLLGFDDLTIQQLSLGIDYRF